VIVNDPWDAPLTQEQWDACKWLFEAVTDEQHDQLVDQEAA
jgi:hypothetical protein